MLPIVYIQLHYRFPFETRWKCGITNRGLMSRSRNIWKSTPGVQFPVFFVVVPFPARFEKWLHRHFDYCHRPLKQGSGRTEWFDMGVLGLNLLSALAMYAALWVVQGLLLWWVYVHFGR